MEAGKTKKVMHGAVLLTIAGTIGKILSATYRIPLQNLTGDLGFYMYQQVYPLIGITMILGLYGFPVAVSKIVAENNASGQSNSFCHVYGPLLGILLLMMLLAAIPLYTFSSKIADWLDTPQLTGAFQLAAGLFLIMPFLALLRGAFQGHDEMAPTAYSQIAEQVIRVTVIIFAAYFVSVEWFDVFQIGSAGMIASLVGTGFVTVFWFIFLISKSAGKTSIHAVRKMPWRYFIKTCFTLGIVAALSHMVLILLQLVDVFTIVPQMVSGGMPAIEAMEWKGIFDRGQPLIQFGAVFGSSFALALVSAVVHEKKGRITAIREAVLFSFYLSGAATAGLICMMPEINALLFLNKAGTSSMQILAMAVVLSAIGITASSILQNMDDVWYVAIWMAIALFVKYVLNMMLVPIFAINGSAIATISSLLVVMFAVLHRLHKKLPALRLLYHIRWGAFFLAIIAMVMFIMLVKYLILFHVDLSRMGLLLYVMMVVCSGAMIYILVLLYYQVLSDKQLQAMPFSHMMTVLQKRMEK